MGLCREFSKDVTHTAEKYLKKHSTSFVINKIQIETFRFYLTPVRIADGQLTAHGSKYRGKGNKYSLLVVVQTDTSTVEISVAMPQEVVNRSNSRSSYATFGHLAPHTTPHPTTETFAYPCFLLFYSGTGNSVHICQWMDMRI